MNKMLEVLVTGTGLKEAILTLVENGLSYEATEILRDDPNFEEAPPLADDDYDSIRFESDEIGTGFVKCGQGLLNDKLVDVYYVADMGNTEVGDKNFIFVENVARGIFVENGAYYSLEEYVLQEEKDSNIRSETNFTDLQIKGFKAGDRVIAGFLDLDGDGENVLTFSIKGEDIDNEEVELENILDSTEDLDSVEDWIINKCKTYAIERV